MNAPVAPRLMVIVLNYRTPKMSLRAVEAALADMPRGAELILVDNASGDGSADVMARAIADRGWDDRVRLIRSAVNGGFGSGNNIGLRATMRDGGRPDYFYLLNSDAFPDPGCIGALLTHLQAHPSAGFAASHVRGEDGVDHITAFRFPSIAGEFEGAVRFGPVSRLLRHAIVAPPLPAATARVDWAAGASVMLSARMLDEVGLFDESFFLYFEETDLMRRAADQGWECWYVPQARAMHIGSVSTGIRQQRPMPSYWFASRRRYFVKHHGRAYAALAWVARLAGSALHALRCRLSGRLSQDPPGFTTDLLRYGLNLPVSGQREVSRLRPSEDRP